MYDPSNSLTFMQRVEENNILEITDKKSALSVTPQSVSWPEGTVLTTAGHQSDHTGPATL